jgi:hypothetical protein
MANDTIHIADSLTGEVIEREMTQDEQKARDAALAETATLQKEAADLAAQAEAAKAIVAAKLEVLGLDIDDLKALGL